MPNDELLLSPEEQSVYKLYGTEGFAGYAIKGLLQAQITKLKAMGYEQVWTKCPDCGGTKRIFRLPVTALGETSNEFPCPTCKGTGRKRKLVKWDREKVAELLFCQVYGGKPPTTGWLVREKLIKDKFREQADQLKEILTGGK